MRTDFDKLLEHISECASYLEERFKEELSIGRLPNQLDLHLVLQWERALGSA